MKMSSADVTTPRYSPNDTVGVFRLLIDFFFFFYFFRSIMLFISCSRKVGLVPKTVRIMVLPSRKKNGLMMLMKLEIVIFLLMRNL